jgi:hypothetical protein
MSRERIAQLAREQAQAGGHYLKRACGQIFDASGNLKPDSVPRHALPAVYLHPNDPGVPIMFAAASRPAGRIAARACAGRYRIIHWPSPPDLLDDERYLREPHLYAWPRPENYLAGQPPATDLEAQRQRRWPADFRATIWGECCIGKRHFDCVGFVNWCFWAALGAEAILEVDQWSPYYQAEGSVPRTSLVPGGPRAAQTADLLFRSGATGEGPFAHIGIAVGNGQVAHAAGHDVGVVVEAINQTWQAAGSPRCLAGR